MRFPFLLYGRHDETPFPRVQLARRTLARSRLPDRHRDEYPFTRILVDNAADNARIAGIYPGDVSCSGHP
jgi:hypothetical protein